MPKQNVRASLVLYARIPELGGWRRGSLVASKTGYRSDAMFHNGIVYSTLLNSTFQIRTYNGSKAKYQNVGSDLTAALKTLERLRASRQLAAAQEALGIVKETEKPKTMAELVEDYIARKSKKSLGLSETSIRHYKDALLGFLKVCRRQYVSEVTEDDVINFIEHLDSNDYSERTQGMRYVSLRGFLRRSGLDVDRVIDSATHAQYLDKMKTGGKSGNSKVKGYDDADLANLFDACDEYHRIVFQFLLYTGLRYREANHLTWNSADFAAGVIRVPRSEEVERTYNSRKAGKRVTTDVKFTVKSFSGAREVPIFDSLLPILKKWREDHPNTTYVFGTKNDLPDNHWLEYGNAAWRRAGLNCGKCKGCQSKSRTAGCERFFLHRFRHSFGHRCADAGVDLDTLCVWMGHYDTCVTRIYMRGRDYKAKFDPFKKQTSAKHNEARSY
jgi:integrase